MHILEIVSKDLLLPQAIQVTIADFEPLISVYIFFVLSVLTIWSLYSQTDLETK